MLRNKARSSLRLWVSRFSRLPCQVAYSIIFRIGTPIGAYGGNGRVRSYGPRVNGSLLCQLSYISKYNRLLRTCGLSARHLFILGLYLVYGCERLGSNQRSPPYEGGEILTSPSRNIVERIQLTYSTSRLFYQFGTPNFAVFCDIS